MMGMGEQDATGKGAIAHGAEDSARNAAGPGSVLDDALFRTKLAPPGRGDMLERPRLTAAFEGSSGKLFIVRAPAGFGKTTLLRQWRDRLGASGIASAWLTLDEADNDPARLLAGLSAAIRQAFAAAWGAGGGAGGSGAAGPASGGGQSGAALVSTLVAGLERSGTPFVLLLDEIDALQSEASRGVIQMLLRHTPAQLRVIVAGRSIPSLGQARLRLADAVAHMGVEDLRFRLDEASALLTDRLDVPLTADQLGVLHQHTGGWAAALQLASLAMRDATSGGQAFRPPALLDRSVTEYLQEDVLGRQTEEIRRFLLDTCILRLLTGDLCNALTGREGGDAILAQMEEDGLFLKRIDSGDGRVWYRYHALFADFLRREALSQPPARKAMLHGAASRWLADRGMVAEAAEQARLGGDPERALALLDGIAMEHVWQGRLRTVHGWSDGLTVEHALRNERLFGAYLWAEGYMGDGARAVRRLDDLARLAAGLPDRSDFLTDTLICLPILLAGARQDLDFLRVQGPVALARFTRTGTFEHGTVANCVAYVHLCTGDLERSRTTLAAAKLAWQPGRSYNMAYTVLFEGHLHLCELKLERALASLSQGYARLNAQESDFSLSSAITASGYADALYEAGRSEAARDILDRHLAMVVDATPDCIISMFGVALRIAVDAQDFERAAELVHDLESHAARRNEDSMRRAARAFRVWLAALTGEVAAAGLLLDELTAIETAPDPGLLSPVDALIRDLSRIRTRLLLGRTDGLPEETDRLLAAARPLGNGRRILRLEILKAAALDRCGAGAAARVQMAAALRRGLAAGFVQCFLNEGAVVRTLVQDVRRGMADAADVASRTALAQLDAALPAAPPVPERAMPAASAAAEAGTHLLTAREQDILHVVERGLTNREIAECFALSETTVKWHLRNIFDKLGVGNRTEAAFLLRRDLVGD